MPVQRLHNALYRNRRGLVLAAISLALPFGCYQRVVDVKQGSYKGDVYDSNLPSNTRGFWQDPAYSPSGSKKLPTAAELDQNANKAYQKQLKELGASSGNSGD